MRMANRAAVAIFLWLSMVACGSDISKPEGAGIRIISDITRTDTIEAQSSFPLVLAISDGTGGLAHPVEVDISGAPASLGHGMIPFDPVSSLSGTFSMSSTGQVSILVQFGSREGQEAITITVPELQLSSTLWFTVKPGRPAYLTLRP